MTAGFMLAAYAIVANDSIQTLGTFLYSNAKRPWWLLFIYSATIMVTVMTVGYLNGDVSWGRLNRFPEVPLAEFSWIYLAPPVVLLLLTRYGFPVSTSFLILVTFKPGNLDEMLVKSIAGYGVAFVVGGIIYFLLLAKLEKFFRETAAKAPPVHWIVLQWCSTAFLWSVWLMQDLANIFVYLPRNLDLGPFILALSWMVLIQAYIYYTQGGKIQKVVRTKTNTADIRSATIVDFIYGVILFVFKIWSDIPMSTTWVFIGLLAGREIAFAYSQHAKEVNPQRARKLMFTDLAKVAFGLAVSVALALALRALK